MSSLPDAARPPGTVGDKYQDQKRQQGGFIALLVGEWSVIKRIDTLLSVWPMFFIRPLELALWLQLPRGLDRLGDFVSIT
jgi:hypothetical protein